MAGDQNYGGIALQFKAIDEDFNKSINKVIKNLVHLQKQSSVAFNAINDMDFGISKAAKNMQESLSFLHNSGQITSEVFQELSSSISAMQFVSASMQDSLNDLRDSGQITNEVFSSMSSYISNIKPEIDLSGLSELSTAANDVDTAMQKLSSSLSQLNIESLTELRDLGKITNKVFDELSSSVVSPKVNLDSLIKLRDSGKITKEVFDQLSSSLNINPQVNQQSLEKLQDSVKTTKEIFDKVSLSNVTPQVNISQLQDSLEKLSSSLNINPQVNQQSLIQLRDSGKITKEVFDQLSSYDISPQTNTEFLVKLRDSGEITKDVFDQLSASIANINPQIDFKFIEQLKSVIQQAQKSLQDLSSSVINPRVNNESLTKLDDSIEITQNNYNSLLSSVLDLYAELNATPFGLTADAADEFSKSLAKMTNIKFAQNMEEIKSSLDDLRKSGLVTEEVFNQLSQSVKNISPKIDLAGMRDVLEYMQENASGTGLRNLEKSVGLEAERQIDFGKYKEAINSQHLLTEAMKANPGLMPQRQFEVTMDKLRKLENKFLNLARKGPNPIVRLFTEALPIVVRSIKNIGSSLFGILKSALSSLPSVSQALIGTGKVSDLSKTLDTLSAQMSVVIDPSKVREFNGGIQDMIRNFGVSGDEARTVAMDMNQFGVSVDKAVTLMPLMGKLIGVMGMDAAQVARMFGQTSTRLAMMPDQMNQLVSEVYALGKAQGFVNFLEDLPEVVDQVVDSFNKLGILNSKTAKKAIESTMALSAMYRRMGVDQKSAIAAAKKVQETTSAMAADIKRMQVGLDPENFDQMVDVAAELSRVTGMGANEAFNTIMQGALDPKNFQAQLMKLTQGIAPQDLFRFSEVMRKSFGDEFANALQNPDMRKAANEAAKIGQQAAKGAGATKELEGAIAKQRDTLTVQERVLASNKELVKAMAELAAKDGIMASWVAQTRELIRIQESIAKQDIFGKAATLAAAMEAGGAAAVAFKLGAQELGDSLARIGTRLDQLNKIAESTSIIGAALSSLGGVLLGLLSGLALPLLKTLYSAGKWALDLIVNMKSFPKLMGPIQSSMSSVFEWMVTKWGAVTSAISSGFSTLMQGITSIGSKLLAPIQGAFSSIFEIAQGTIGKVLGFFSSKVGSLISYFTDAFSSVAKFAGKLLGPLAALISSFEVGWQIGKLIESLMQKFAPDAWAKVIEFIDSSISAIAKKLRKIPFLGEAIFGPEAKDQIGFNPDFYKNLPKQAEKQAYSPVAPHGADLVVPPKDKSLDIASMFSGKETKTSLLAPQKPIGIAEVSPGLEVPKQLAEKTPVQPLLNQQGAPKLSASTKYKPALKEKETGNTLDDVVTALVDLREIMRVGFEGLGDKAVNVTVQGDVKKFLTAVANEGKNAMGIAGYGNAIAGGV